MLQRTVVSNLNTLVAADLCALPPEVQHDLADILNTSFIYIHISCALNNIHSYQDISANHGQQGSTINWKYCDEKLDRKLWDAEDDGRLVGRVEDGGDTGSNSEGDKPRYADNDTDHFDGKDGVFSKRQAWGLKSI